MCRMSGSDADADCDARHWRGRAEEARLLAHDMKDGPHKEAMLRVAARYDRLAQRAEERANALT